MEQKKLIKLIKQGQDVGNGLADVIAAILDKKYDEVDKDNPGVVLRVAAIHSLATVLLNSYPDDMSMEVRLENTKGLVNTYFSHLNLDNIAVKKK